MWLSYYLTYPLFLAGLLWVEGQVWEPLAEGMKNAFCSASQLPGEGRLCGSQLGKLVSGRACERKG